MRAVDADALLLTHKAETRMLGKDWTVDDLATAIELAPTVTPERPKAVWHYHNDEHGVWWGCGNCGKIVHKPPLDKLFCSRCGAAMSREA